MPCSPTPLPDELSHAVFSTQEAHASGVSRVRLRAGDLTPLSRGLWVRRDRALTEREIVAALCRRDPAAFAMGLTAARILGLPLPGIFAEGIISPPPARSRPSARSGPRRHGRGADRRIHLGTGRSRGRDTDLVRWSLVSSDALSGQLLVLKGAPPVRTTSRLRTFMDLGSILRTDALVAVGDHLVRAPRPFYEGRTRRT